VIISRLYGMVHNMYRKGVSALIQNKNNEFLLVNLNSFEERFFAIPGGGVEEGESLEDAVYREIEEELGIHKQSLELMGKNDIPLQFRFTVPKIKEGKEYAGSERYFFSFRFIGTDDEIVLQESEVRAYKWVSFGDLDKYLLFDGQLGESKREIREIFPELE
jgi:putative (di)nucleoside polyphosphate hydrolase